MFVIVSVTRDLIGAVPKTFPLCRGKASERSEQGWGLLVNTNARSSKGIL